MNRPQTVLLLGGSGRTGQLVMRQLLGRGIGVRAIIRPGRALAPEVAGDPHLHVTEASLLALTGEELQRHVRDCDAVISCLGHAISLRGIFGPPRDLVTRATSEVCRAIEALKPASPVKFILMSSVSVIRAGGRDTRRSALEKAVLRTLCAMIPPAGDNQRAADFLQQRVGESHAFVQWAAVRPDTLLPGDVSEYTVHDSPVDTLFSPGETNMANVAHFMCELVANPKTWAEWQGRLPVIVNTRSTTGTTPRPSTS